MMSSFSGDLVPVWTAILGIGVFMYVLLDGFDLGVGILYGFVGDTGSRNLVIGSITPVWDGNETWLILGAVGLMAAFPTAFAIIIPAIYFPVAIMLLALVFRGVAFEFRYRDAERRGIWDHGFCYGSILATFSQGVVLGAFIQGFTTDGTTFTGGSFDCFTPFSVLTGISLLFGYALLGAGWLILKTEGELQATMRRLGRWALLLVLTAIFVVSLWTLAAHHAIAARWFGSLQGLWFAPVPLLSVCAAIWAWFAFAGTRSASPFLAGIALFVLAYVGMIISLWPMIVPYRLSLWQAASPPATQAFLLVGTLGLLPVILLYTAWSYWVFRGKVRAEHGYG
jgi:cytochrome d ubiquinol oxidase subunit II